MNEEKTNVQFSILFYVISAAIIAIINVSGEFKSGPCAPNLDVVSYLLVAFSSVILLIINGFKAFVMNKQTKYSFFIHLAVLTLWLINLL